MPGRSRRGPAVCAMCGGRIEGKAVVSGERGPSRGKPVHGSCEEKPAAFTARRREAQRAAGGGPVLSLKEENRRLFAAQDRIRELRRQRDAERAAAKRAG
ncbi:conserved hypothetical protein [Streptomyces clavuligerus]|uniref:Uncharacterized protein n=2 Tax=Streptomyces clavuligerus TaxID=1901 RepID=Q6TMQ4_STRCL|nr:hypothetical protein pSCL2.6.A8.15c [Streptomyces clavuligerus]EDY48714.1 conserved hypothetical protein [Streptomyces clavuligerus]